MEDISLENNCKCIAFEYSDLFICAFPGKIVFGEVCCQDFVQHRYFKFLHFEIFNLYLALVNILNFLVSEEDEIEPKGLILQLTNDILYFWQGKKVIKNK